MAEYVGYVFKITFPDGKIYIGLTTKDINKSYYGYGSKSYRALVKSVGKTNLEKDILCYCKDLDELASKETHYIKKYDSTNPLIGHNKCIGQHPNTLVNNSLKGSANPMYGRTHSEDTRAKLRKANLGRTVPINVREKIRESTSGDKNHFFGKQHSKESAAKISSSNSRKVIKYSLEWVLIQEYESIKEASKSIDKGNIVDALLKGYRKAGGYYWLREGEIVDEVKHSLRK